MMSLMRDHMQFVIIRKRVAFIGIIKRNSKKALAPRARAFLF
jgi:hypothetical protein